MSDLPESRHLARLCVALILAALSLSAPGQATNATADPAIDGAWERLPYPSGDLQTCWDSVHRRFIAYRSTDGRVWVSTPDQSTSWREFSPVGPVPYRRSGAALVYDPLRDRLLVHGGYLLYPTNELWAFDLSGGSRWTQIELGGEYISLARHTAVYDSREDRVIFFGGSSGFGISNYTYSLDLANPSQLDRLPTNGLEPRRYHAAVIDSARRRMYVLFGSIAPNNNPPTSLVQYLSLDPPYQWVNLDPTGVTETLTAGTAIIDELSDRIIVAGGPSGTLWSTSASAPGAWSPAAPAVPTRSPETVRLGQAGTGEIQVLSGLAEIWSRAAGSLDGWLLASGHPTGRPAALIHDSARNRLLLIETPSCAVWELRMNAPFEWRQLARGGAHPPARSQPAACLDWRRDRLLLHGGYYYDTYDFRDHDYFDTWSFDLTADGGWTPVEAFATGGWVARSQHALLYDGVRDRMLVVGGARIGYSLCAIYYIRHEGLVRDVVALDFTSSPATWRPVIEAQPGIGLGMQACELADGDSTLLLGGRIGLPYCSPGGGGGETFSYLDTLRVFDATPRIVNRTVSGNLLPGRSGASAVLERAGNRVILYGGTTQLGATGDVWQLSLEPAAGWQPLHPEGVAPGASTVHRSAYVPSDDAMWMVSPAGDGTTWRLRWLRATPTQFNRQSVDVDAKRVRIVWQVPGASQQSLGVRRTNATDLVALPLAMGTQPDMFALTDSSIVPGGNYKYELVTSRSRGVVALDEVHVSVPQQFARLSLRARYDEAADAVRVTLLAPQAAGYSLAITDVSGRRVRRERLGHLQAGEHDLRIAFGRGLSSGLYFVSVEDGIARASARLTIIR